MKTVAVKLQTTKVLGPNNEIIEASLDDMIKSILITKHIAMLSSGGTLQNIYYIINAKYKAALENILQLNMQLLILQKFVYKFQYIESSLVFLWLVVLKYIQIKLYKHKISKFQ